MTVVAATLVADAQPSRKAYRIGFLRSSSPASARHLVEAFRQSLGELGWIEGQNLAIEYRFADGHHERLPELAGEHVFAKGLELLEESVPRLRRVAILSNPANRAQPSRYTT